MSKHRAVWAAGAAFSVWTGLASGAQAQNALWLGWDFSIEAGPSFLTAAPRNVFAQDLTFTLPGTLRPTDRHIDAGFGGNARILGAYRWGEMDVSVGYRATFSATQYERADLSINPPTTFTIPIYPGVIQVGGAIIPIGGVSGQSEARSLLHAVDAEFGHNMRYGWGELRLFAGARFAHYSQSINSRFSNFGAAEFDVRRSLRFTGIGPRAGLNTTVPLSENWWLHAGVSGSVLFGTRRTSESHSLSVPPAAFAVSDSNSNNAFHTVYSFDAEVNMTYFFGNGWYGSFGYGVQSYLGLNDTRRVDPFTSLLALSPQTTGTSAGHIINHGPFVRLGWRPVSGPAGISGGPALPFKGTIGIETRLYPQAPLYQGQEPQDFFSFWGELDLTLDLADSSKIVVKPFFRYDAVDAKRTHWDLREAYWQKEFQDFRVRAGVGRVFWGAAESLHLIDIVNQIDAVENVDQEDRLGQPMVQFSIPRSWGTLDLFYLPYSRERTFAGRDGRLRSRFEIDTASTQWEGGLGQWYPTFAARYSHTIEGLDFGLHFFHGLSRDPSFKAISLQLPGNLLPPARIIPFYQIINQGGIDAVYTTGQWQFKFEGLVRGGFNNTLGQEQTYGAFAGGFEYTFKGFFGTGVDFGVLGEFLYDSRGRQATTPFENDLFLGARFRLNDKDDTRILLGYIQDVRDSDKVFFVEASRRIADRWRFDFEARFFANTSADRPLHEIRRDSHFRLRLSYKF